MLVDMGLSRRACGDGPFRDWVPEPEAYVGGYEAWI